MTHGRRPHSAFRSPPKRLMMLAQIRKIDSGLHYVDTVERDRRPAVTPSMPFRRADPDTDF